VAVRFIDRQTLNKGLHDDMNRFLADSRQASIAAAEEATKKSRQVFNSRLSKRPPVQKRDGRPTTGGNFDSYIDWRPVRDGHAVRVNIEKLERAAPYWLIQEIGTGPDSNYTMKDRDTQTSVSVKSQRGRRLPGSLHWEGAPPTGQLVEGRRAHPGTITTEIKGKGYIRIGGNRGFRVYDSEMEKAFRRAFGHHPK
jgi:hypothetical protein